MQTLSYGYKLPEDRDSGSTLFTALEGDITQLNLHDHNGTNSAKLTTAAMTSVTQSVAAGSWVLVSQGNYRQLMTMPGSLSYDEVSVMFKTSLGHVVHPTVEKVSPTTYYVYTNENSTGFTAFYLS